MLGLHAFILVFVFDIQSVMPDYMTQIVCFGESLKLVCKVGRRLEIHGAQYEMLDSTSQHCRHLRQSTFGCDRAQMTEKVQHICDGKGECWLGYGVHGQVTSIHCQASMYLRVKYRCSTNAILSSGSNVNPKSGPDTRNILSTTPPPWLNTDPVNVKNMTYSNSDDGSLYFTILRLFVQFSAAGEYMGSHSLWLVLCVVASFAVGILILILYALLFKFCSKYAHKKRTHHEIVASPVEAVPPITPAVAAAAVHKAKTEKRLVTRHNDTPFSDTSIASDSAALITPSPKTKDDYHHKHEIISTIRRTHSVDEQTQTTADQPITSNAARTLSATEMQELGFLVADLKVYESQIEESIRMASDKPSTSQQRTSRDYDNIPNFFFSGEPSSSQTYTEPKSFKQEKYLTPFPTSHSRVENTSNCDRTKYNNNNRHQDKELCRYPSEISYETSTSDNASEEQNIKESYLLGDVSRLTSMQRNHKLGVRGDGFDYIVGDTRPK